MLNTIYCRTALGLASAWILAVALVACQGGGGGSSVNLIPQRPTVGPTLEASPALPTPPPPPTPVPQPFPTSRLVGEQTYAPGDTSSGGQGSPVDGISCDFAAVHFHIHSHLSLFYQGIQIAIPLAIGIVNPVISDGGRLALNGSCLYHLHTHDSTGLIHIENQAPGTFTLGQVFDIWGEPLTRSNVAGFTGPVLVYIANCSQSRSVPFLCDPPTVYTGDPRAIVLSQHEQITIEVGGPYVWPLYYSWTV